MKKPKTLEEYKKWSKSQLKLNLDDITNSTFYEANINRASVIVGRHKFFVDLADKLGEWERVYEKTYGSTLLMNSGPPNMITKSYISAIDKAFRFNVLWNESFPNPRDSEWITLNNLFQHFNDCIRGTLVCKFIDGPKYLAEKLTEFANLLNLKNTFYSQESDEGYYAYHFYVFLPVSLLDKSFNPYDTEIQVEIQITTQFQEVLKNLTHKFYEQDRLNPVKRTSKWKWEYESNNFKVGYLSHTLHLLESIIWEARSVSNKSKKTNKGKKQITLVKKKR